MDDNSDNQPDAIADQKLTTVNLLTSQQVADRIGISARTLWRMVARGRFPQPVRMNRKLVRWKSRDIDAYIDALETHP